MIGNKQKKIGKQVYSTKELFNIARICVDKGISSLEAKKKYFKNNPYQFLYFLKILQCLLDIVKTMKIINSRNLSYKTYIDSLKNLRDELSYYNGLYEKAKLELDRSFSQVDKEVKMFVKSANNVEEFTVFERFKFKQIMKTYGQFIKNSIKKDFIEYKLYDSKSMITKVEKDIKNTIETYDDFLLSSILGLF